LDVNEVNAEAINTPVGMFMAQEGTRPILNSIFNDTRMAEHVAVPGDQLLLNGNGLMFADYSNAWIVIRNGEKTYLKNIRPNGVTDYGLVATLPSDAAGEVVELFVVKGNQRTASIHLKLISGQSPVLQSVSQIDDNTLEIEGLNLNKATALVLNEKELPLNAGSPTKAQLNIPNGLKSGYAWLVGSNGSSNFVQFWLRRKISGNLAFPGLTLDNNKITVSQSLSGETPINASGNFLNAEIIIDEASLLHVFYEYASGEYALIGQGVVLKDNDSPRIDFETTAVALMWNAIDIWLINPEKYGDLYEDIRADENVKTLADYLKTGLASNINLISDWTDTGLKSALEKAAVSVSDMFYEKYNNASARTSVQANNIPKGLFVPNAAVPVTPTITPSAKWALDWVDNIIYYDPQYPGQVVIRNDTQLQIVYEVSSLNNPSKIITSYDLSDRIGPQKKLYENSWFVLPDISEPYAATEKRIDLKGVSSRIQIMTDAHSHEKYAPLSIPKSLVGQYWVLFNDGFLMNAVQPIANVALSMFFSDDDVKKILGEDFNVKTLKLVFDELVTASIQSLDSELTNESPEKWGQDTLKALITKLHSSFPGILEAVLKEKFGKKEGFISLLKKFNIVMKFASIVKEGAWMTFYLSDTGWNDSVIDFDVVFPGGSTPVTPNWADIADVSWYSPYKTEFTIPTVPQRAAEQLAGLAEIVNGTGVFHDNFKDKTITLTADINIAGRQWTPIGNERTFRGTFNGGGSTIANLTIETAAENDGDRVYGLFGWNDYDGNIKNIHLTGVKIATSSSYDYDSHVGGIVGYNGGTVTSCDASGSVFFSSKSYNSRSRVGGIVGWNGGGGTVTSCDASGSVSNSSNSSNSDFSSAYSYAGGIVGYNAGTVTSCDASSSVSSFSNSSSSNAFSYAGGIAGYNLLGGTVTGCTASGSVSSNSSLSATSASSFAYAGGIAGENWKATVTDCTASNSVSSSSDSSSGSSYAFAGGITGYNNESTVTGCTASGSVTANSSQFYYHRARAGGIAGENEDGTVTGCTANGSISSSSYNSSAGGIVGVNDGTVTDCTANGSVSNTYDTYDTYSSAGGILGVTGTPNSTIENNKFSGTGQTYGIGMDMRKEYDNDLACYPPSNDGCTPY
jgi:hypothetical protein